MSFDIIWNQNVNPVINLILLQFVPLIKPIIACGIVRLHCLHEIKYLTAQHYFIVRWWEMFIRITADHFENYTISCGSELKHVDWVWCEFANQTLPPHNTTRTLFGYSFCNDDLFTCMRIFLSLRLPSTFFGNENELRTEEKDKQVTNKLCTFFCVLLLYNFTDWLTVVIGVSS